MPANGILKAALEPLTAEVFVHLPADYLSRMPCVQARRVGGGDIDPRFTAERPTVQVDAYDADPAACEQLALDAKGVLVAAWQDHTPVAGGYVQRVSTVSGPFEIREPDQPDSFARFTATYQLITRPA